ncbi:hypothetical protein [Streptomyces similanensis]|uniref:Uncharacterized protein n=1 Tax=Streptomyces similanensis TaxID=1274988 RepID=A0ABP9KQ97_9ACTN
MLERITARRAELDEPEEQPVKQLAEIRAERDELAVAERVLERVSEQLAQERAETAPVPGQVSRQAVMMIPHRAPGVEETALPADYQRILAAVRQAAGPASSWPCCATISAWPTWRAATMCPSPPSTAGATN